MIDLKKQKAITVEFLGEKCSMHHAQYRSGAPAIQLICEDGSPMATATVNLEENPPKGHIFIKDYNENQGIAQAFQNSKLGEIIGRKSAGQAQDGIAILKITDPLLLEMCYPINILPHSKRGNLSLTSTDQNLKI